MNNKSILTDLVKSFTDLESAYYKLNKERVTLDKTEQEALEQLNELLKSSKDPQVRYVVSTLE